MKQKTILIVDDNPQFRDLMCNFLKNSDYLMLEASDGGQALSIIKEVNVDVILLDILMPEMGGFEFLRELRQENITTKVIAVSGGGQVEGKVYTNVASIIGADKELPKPFTQKELLEALDTVLTNPV